MMSHNPCPPFSSFIAKEPAEIKIKIDCDALTCDMCDFVIANHGKKIAMCAIFKQILQSTGMNTLFMRCDECLKAEA